jgi:hypothetical protein
MEYQMEQDRWNRTDVKRDDRIPNGTGQVECHMEQDSRLDIIPRWNKAADWLERNSMW